MKVLMKGNEALAEAAIRAGCRYYFGYPITPACEVAEYLSKNFPIIGGHFKQPESELAVINMVFGASAAGARVLTSTSGCGMALMQEGISYLCGADLPCVIADIMRAGPGLGSILPSQTDYFLATRGGGNGDYRTPVFAPSTIQEIVDLTLKAFDIADKYRNPVLILADGVLGQMMEAVDFGSEKIEPENLPEKIWACDGKDRGHKNIVTSVYLSAEGLEKSNRKRFEKYEEISDKEVMYEKFDTEDCDIVLTAYGTSSRVCKSAKNILEKEGIKVGIIRPVTLWPYPYNVFKDIKCEDILVVEMNLGQMIDDVKISVEGRQKVHFYGRQGGFTPTSEEIANQVRKILEI